jgi:MFS family permease
MENKQWPKFPVLFSLYIAQSVPMSFFSTVVPVIMRQESYSLESIGLLQLVKLPWILKFLWAPLVDNHARTTRQLKRWIFISELFYAGVIVSIAHFNLQTDFKIIIALLVLAFVASATQDIATDAFAIFILKPAERGLGNSMQSAGSFMGSLLGTGALLIAYYYFGWEWLLFLLAAFVAFALIPLMLYNHHDPPAEKEKPRVNLSDIYQFFIIPGMGKRVLLLIFYYSGIIGILAMLKPWMVDLGYSAKEIGFMSGIVGTSVAALAALAAGLIVKKIGRRTSLFVFAIVNMIAGGYFYFLTGGIPSLLSVYAGICLLWGAYGLSTVAIYTTSMDLVRKGREGTDFTVQIVITHLSGLIIAVLSGHVGDKIGYSGLFMVSALLGLISIGIVLFNYRKKDLHEI